MGDGYSAKLCPLSNMDEPFVYFISVIIAPVGRWTDLMPGSQSLYDPANEEVKSQVSITESTHGLYLEEALSGTQRSPLVLQPPYAAHTHTHTRRECIIQHWSTCENVLPYNRNYLYM